MEGLAGDCRGREDLRRQLMEAQAQSQAQITDDLPGRGACTVRRRSCAPGCRDSSRKS